MKEPRNDSSDEEFNNIVTKLKKYEIPYSAAHIRDRLNKYSPKYESSIREDITFLSGISHNMAIGFDDSNKRLLIGSQDIMDAYNLIKKDILSEKKQIIDTAYPFYKKVDMSKLSPDHPMFDFLSQRNGEISNTSMNDFFQYLYNKIFKDKETYSKFRNYIKNSDIKNDIKQNTYTLDEAVYLLTLMDHLMPFIESFDYDENKLSEKWDNITDAWFSFNSPNIDTLYKLNMSYSLLDLHPLFNEKLKKDKNVLDNIIRDGNHCMFASKAKYYVSEDKNTRKKTSFIYKSFNINTQVLSISEFINKFC
ncbi:MAG: hypothetical protein Q4D76_17205 [Oscillospiraceae bacterium]|nr:hypothetical protein [Oscillospiraceae bacterium]